MTSRRDFFSRFCRTASAGVGGAWLGLSRPAFSVSNQRPTHIDANPTIDSQRLAGVEELRGLGTATRTGSVWLEYYTAPGDGGGGLLLLDANDTTSIDNHGTIFRSKAGDAWKRPNQLDVTVAQFGAQGLMTSNDAIAIQRACDAVCPVVGVDEFPAGRVWLDVPRRGYLLNSTLNLTNTRALGSRQRDGLTLEGPGHFSARLIGAAGEGRAVIETTGSQWLTLRNLRIEAHEHNGSTIGIYQGIGQVLPETQNQKFERIYIDLPDNAAANNGIGSIGILNFGAEENTYECCYVTANAPAIFTAEDFGYKHSYVSQLSAHSLGMTTFIGENFLVSKNARSPSLATQDVDTFYAPSLFLANIGAGGDNRHAWQIRGGFFNGAVGGLIEGHAVAFKAFGRLQNASVHFLFGGIQDRDAPRFELEAGSEGMIWESSLTFADTEFPNRPLMSCKPQELTQRVPCFIRNTNIRCGADARYLAIQENVLGNTKTGNVSIEGFRGDGEPWRWNVEGSRQSLNIPPVLIGAVEAELCRLVLPVITRNENALCGIVGITGLMSSQSKTVSISANAVDRMLSFKVAEDGEVEVQALASNFDLRGCQQLGCFILSGKPIKDANGLYISIVVTQASDSHGKSIVFTGCANMSWHGYNHRAPRLTSSV